MSDPAAPVPALRDRLIVASEVPVMDTGMFDQMTRIAKLMASSSLVPVHLNSVRKEGGRDVDIGEGEAIANCFLVVNQAIRWRMDPFAVAQHVYVTKGRVGYEGKLIAAVINSHPAIEKRLTYKYEGAGEKRKVVVSAKLKDDTEVRSVEGTVEFWKTTGAGSPWLNASQHDQMLSYRGAREWARRWLPEAVLGLWGDDELEFESMARPVAGANETERSGAFRLRSHLENAADAEVVPAKGDTKAAPAAQEAAEPKPGAEPAAEPKPEPKELRPASDVEKGAIKHGSEGTPALRDSYIVALKASTNVDLLDLKRDEANFLRWTPEDLKQIDDAYKARRAEIVAP